MKNSWLNTIAILVLGALFHLCFFQKGLGINAFLFTSASFGFSLYKKEWKSISKLAKIVASSTLLLAIALLFHTSVWTQLLWVFGIVLSLALIVAEKTQFLLFALMQSLTHLVYAFSTGYRYLLPNRPKQISWYNFNKWAQYIVVIFLVGLAFFFLYSTANLDFFNTNLIIIEKLFAWLPPIHGIDWWAFCLLALAVAIAILHPDKRMLHFFQTKEAAYFINKKRRRKVQENNPYPIKKSSIALKTEYQFALLLLLALNALTLFYNFNDFLYVLKNKDKALPYELSAFVHEGTYILIISVLIAIAIVLYFFRNNLHFYPNNKKLKVLAKAWMIQNIFLALLVTIRNIWYVVNCGLTMKRIGVFVFIALVISILGFCYKKIQAPKTIYFVIKNTIATLFFTLATLGLFNLEAMISHFNIQNAQQQYFDANYLINELSHRNINALEYQLQQAVEDAPIRQYEQQIIYKRKKMERMKAELTWQEWSFL